MFEVIFSPFVIYSWISVDSSSFQSRLAELLPTGKGTTGSDKSLENPVAKQVDGKGKGKEKGKFEPARPAAKPAEDVDDGILSEFFYESGLVLETSTAMKMVSDFLLAHFSRKVLSPSLTSFHF